MPDVPFPPYAFVPGQQPHPISDPSGHSFGLAHTEPDPELPNQSFLFGVDLFNHGYYWEAHEVWEGLWSTIDRGDPHSAFLQGLIHLAAAGVKVREGQPAGVRSHGRRALHHFQRATPHYGLTPQSLGEMADAIADRAEEWPRQEGAAVAVVFPFPLIPGNPSR